MAKISTYPIVSIPTLNDLLIGTDVENLNETKNFSLADIQALIVVGSYVPYTGALQDVDLGSYGITANYFAVPGGLSTQFLKADGSIDSTSYQPAGNYITGLSGEASASGPGVANVTLNNGAVIGKVLTGLSVTGGSISSTDSILQAFGKLQNQVNSLYGGAIYQGTWDAATNNPALSSGVGTQGWYYIVNVAGSTNLDGITDWNVGDWAIFDGTAWQQVDNTDTVVSVNGQVGVVVLTTTNIAEGTNLYYLDSRARAAITLTTSGSSGASSYSSVTGILNVPNYTISGLGGVPSTRQLTINGTAYDLSVDRSWSVGTVTSVGTSAPLTGGTITGSGTIGITQAGISSNGYLSSTDWNTFNNKQNALTNPVTGTGTLYYIPMWTGTSALSDSIISYNSNIVTFNYNSISGATVSYTNLGSGVYTYTIQMNNFGSPRQTYHSYTDGNIIQQINSNIVSSNLQSGQLVLPYYTTTTSFSGTVAGYLGFDSAGNILTFAGPSLTGYVPYTGATQDVNLGEFGLTAGQLTLDTSPTGTATVATTIWNDSIGSSQTTLKGGSVLLKNGVDLVTRVVNKVFPNATLTRAAYQAVRVSGAQGQRLAVDYALADGDPNSADTLGLVCETIATNQEGFIITVGLLDGVNTTGSLQGETWNDGDVLYLSPTIPGGVTNIKPNASTGHIVIMGYVEYAHAINGKIYVKIMNGWELDELHNVYINTPLNNQGLFYSSSTQLWQNKSIDTALGYTPVNKAGDTMTGYLILNADPVNSLGAATKEYVDNLVNGIDWKQAANAGTVASLPTYIVSGGGQVLTGFANGAIPSATTDGVTLVAGNRVLVKSETSTLTPNNGIYVVTQAGSGSQPFILTRSSDANTSALLSEATLSISGGFTLSNTQWHCNPAATPIVIGSTYITFTQIGSGVYFGTAPISVSGNTISISQSNISTDGYLSSTDWNTFNSKQNTITLTTTGSSGSATFISNTLNVPTYTLNGLGGASATTTLTINGDSYDLSANRTWSVGTVTSVAALTIGTSGTDITSSVANSSTTPVITLNVPTASATNRGALSSADWSTFNNKQETITLTTTGTSGAATLVGSTLNIPQYQSVITNPVTGIGVTNELTFWTSSTSIGNLSTATYPSLTEISYVKGVTSDIQSQINSKQSTITLTTTGSSGSATFVSNTLNVPTYTLTGLGGVPTTRSLTINGTSYDLSADRTWSVGTVTSVAALTLGTSGTDLTSSVATGTTTPVITLNVPTASATNRGALSSTDWSTFNAKQDAITLTTTGTSGAATLVGATLNIPQYQAALTNPVTGTGTTNELTYWTSSSAVGSLSTATYPSLTELSYVKGVTSAIQTQLNAKQDTITLTTTGTSGAATLVGSTLNIPQYSGGGSMAIGGTVTSGTTGSILFINPTATLAQDNANFFWDNTNKRLGIGTNAPSYTFDIPANNTSAIQHRVGTFQVQSYSLNNGFVSDNMYYNGSTWTRTSTGYGYGLQFFNGQLCLHGVATGSGSFTQNVKFKFDYEGAFVIGNNISMTQGNYTGATALFTKNGRLLLGTTTESTFLLDVNGTVRFQDDLTFSNTKGFIVQVSGTNRATKVIPTNTADNFSSLAFYPNSGTNVGQAFQVSPKGTGYSATIKAQFSIFNTDIVADSTNWEAMVVRSAGTAFTIATGKGGTGTIRPLLLSSGYADNVTNPNQLWLYTSGSVGINTATENASAQLQVDSTTKGFLPPRMTTTQKNAIATPAAGLVVYQTDGAEGTYVYTSLGWQKLETTPITTTTASTATLTPNVDAANTFTITAQAASLSIANPTGTPVNGQKMIIRIKDNGTARAITFSGTQYRASSDLAFPTTTIVNKTLYMGFIWNSTDSKWDMLALLNNF